MKLYHAAASPFVRKVHVTLLETGLIDQTEIVPVVATPAQADAGPVAQNPLGKIPALERDDGPSLYDSRVICRYLDHLAQAGLYPEPPRLWETLTLEATADGIMEAAVLMVYESRVREAGMQSELWLTNQWAKVSRGLDGIEDRWMSHLEGPLTMAQIAVGCALGYLDFRHDARGWREGRPALADWGDAFFARDSMAATVPAG